jgi:hypothetical protein
MCVEKERKEKNKENPKSQIHPQTPPPYLSSLPFL